jgi:hypothetical protein
MFLCPICLFEMELSLYSSTYMCRKINHMFDYNSSMDEWYLYIPQFKIEMTNDCILQSGKTLSDFSTPVDLCQSLDVLNKYLKIRSFI